MLAGSDEDGEVGKIVGRVAGDVGRLGDEQEGQDCLCFAQIPVRALRQLHGGSRVEQEKWVERQDMADADIDVRGDGEDQVNRGENTHQQKSAPAGNLAP